MVPSRCTVLPSGSQLSVSPPPWHRGWRCSSAAFFGRGGKKKRKEKKWPDRKKPPARLGKQARVLLCSGINLANDTPGAPAQRPHSNRETRGAGCWDSAALPADGGLTPDARARAKALATEEKEGSSAGNEAQDGSSFPPRRSQDGLSVSAAGTLITPDSPGGSLTHFRQGKRLCIIALYHLLKKKGPE